MYALIEYYDHYGNASGDWYTQGAMSDAAVRRCIRQRLGYIAYEDDSIIILAAARRENEWADWLAIEKPLIIKRTELVEAVTPPQEGDGHGCRTRDSG